MSARWAIGRGNLLLVEGDITRADAEAIVNAANPQLMGGGGVDGAIHRAAGPELLAVGRKWVEENGPLATGGAVITPGFNLRAAWVIHTVGPVWRGGSAGEPELLRKAYISCLKQAQEHGLKSVAFPAISCGAYGYPLDQAATVALEALRDGLEHGLIAECQMYLFSGEHYGRWLAAANELLGNPE